MLRSSRSLRLLPVIAAALVGVGWCWVLVGTGALDPRNVGWTLQGDWAMAQLSQSFFRDEPWRLPLGEVDGFLHPVGTTLASSDGIPWLGLLVRPFAPLLPRDFQVLGAWLALCFGLQGTLGALLTARLSAVRIHQFLGGVLFVLMPILSGRMGHLALCAQWLLLGMLWLCLQAPGGPREVRRRHLLGALFVVLAAGIHPYLCAMVLTLGFALSLQPRTPGAFPRAALAWSGLYLALAGAVMGTLGYLSAAGGVYGFAHYSANLLTFFNSAGRSLLLPSIPVGSGQYEGYGYLGAGVLALGLLTLGALGLMRRRRVGGPPLAWRRFSPLLLACGLMGVFSLSSRVLVGPWQVISFTRIFNALLGPVAETFRAPGRFIWPLAYLCVAGVLALLFHLLRARPRLATAALGAAVLLQAAEPPRGADWGPPALEPLRSAGWTQAGKGLSHLVLYPPLLRDGAGAGCDRPGFSVEEAALFAGEAFRQGLTVNSGAVARQRAAAQDYCRTLEAQLLHGSLDPGTLYVVHRDAEASFLARVGAQGRCGRLDGWRVCVSTAAPPEVLPALGTASQGR